MDGRIRNVVDQMRQPVSAGRMPLNDQVRKRMFKEKALQFLRAGGVTSSDPAKQNDLTGKVVERARGRQG